MLSKTFCWKVIEPATLLSHCLCLDLREKCDPSEGMRLWRWPSWNYLCINQTRPKSCGIFVWFKSSKSGRLENKRNRTIDHSSNLWLYKTIVSVEAPFHCIFVEEKRENDIFFSGTLLSIWSKRSWDTKTRIWGLRGKLEFEAEDNNPAKGGPLSGIWVRFYFEEMRDLEIVYNTLTSNQKVFRWSIRMAAL